jgi:hypothetical protein
MDIVFTAPPGPSNECVFVEIEIGSRSVRVGQWITRSDGRTVLRFAPKALETVTRLTNVAIELGQIKEST